MEWTEEYSVNIKAIDIQHQGIFDIVSKYQVAYDNGEKESGLKNLVNELYNYTRNHFKDEEDLFIKHQYPDAQNHINEHKKILRMVRDLVDRVVKGDRILSVELDEFIRTWITVHIKKTDKKYSVFLNEKGVQ